MISNIKKNHLPVGTRVRLKARTLSGWKGKATMLAWGDAIKDGHSDRLTGEVTAAPHEWAVLRDQTPAPEHATLLDADRELVAVGSLRERMLLAAIPLAERYGYDSVSRDMVARAAGVSSSLLSRYWTAPDFHDALIRKAIEKESYVVLAQALAFKHPAALAAPEDLKQRALEWIAS